MGLRKCAAATLDVLSESLAQEVLLVTLPILQEKSFHQIGQYVKQPYWPFGAMSNSFMKLSGNELPSLVPF